MWLSAGPPLLRGAPSLPLLTAGETGEGTLIRSRGGTTTILTTELPALISLPIIEGRGRFNITIFLSNTPGADPSPDTIEH